MSPCGRMIVNPDGTRRACTSAWTFQSPPISTLTLPSEAAYSEPGRRRLLEETSPEEGPLAESALRHRALRAAAPVPRGPALRGCRGIEIGSPLHTPGFA